MILGNKYEVFYFTLKHLLETEISAFDCDKMEPAALKDARLLSGVSSSVFL